MKKILVFFYLCFVFHSLGHSQDDTLTSFQCDNPDQIVAKQNAVRIEYSIHGYELNIKTMKDYLYNNSSSRPYIKKYSLLRIGSLATFSIGLGALITNLALEKPLYHPLGLGGASLMIVSFPIYFKSNEKFRLGIYHYNRSVCQKKAF